MFTSGTGHRKDFAIVKLTLELGSPFQSKAHTCSAVLCGDFNVEPTESEYVLIQADPVAEATGLTDAWRLAHGVEPHDPTFRLFDRRYGPVPIACDFVFVSDDLKSRVRRLQVNTETRASDHQPVLLELG